MSIENQITALEQQLASTQELLAMSKTILNLNSRVHELSVRNDVLEDANSTLDRRNLEHVQARQHMTRIIATLRAQLTAEQQAAADAALPYVPDADVQHVQQRLDAEPPADTDAIVIGDAQWVQTPEGVLCPSCAEVTYQHIRKRDDAIRTLELEIKELQRLLSECRWQVNPERMGQ